MGDATKCPACGLLLPASDSAVRCPECNLYLAEIPTRRKRLAGYALSMPERLSRVAAGSLAGLVKGISELVLPDVVRQTKIYQVLLEKNLRYLIHEVGSVEGVYGTDSATPSHYMARKFVGNFMEIAGVLTLRVSPVWILAVVSDISGGTKIFLKELAQELRREGLLDPNAPVDSIDQLLEGLQSVSARVADRIDTPPISVTELRETLQYLRADLQAFRIKNPVKHEEMDSILTEMKAIAERENKSLYEISAAIGMSVMNRLERSGRRAVTGLRVGHALLDRTIFRYYGRALRDLSRQGYYSHVAHASKPYLRALRRHLAWKNITWTERYFLGRVWKRTPE